jgi:hypothetical protein
LYAGIMTEIFGAVFFDEGFNLIDLIIIIHSRHFSKDAKFF